MNSGSRSRESTNRPTPHYDFPRPPLAFLKLARRNSEDDMAESLTKPSHGSFTVDCWISKLWNFLTTLFHPEIFWSNRNVVGPSLPESTRRRRMCPIHIQPRECNRHLGGRNGVVLYPILKSKNRDSSLNSFCVCVLFLSLSFLLLRYPSQIPRHS